MPREARFVAEVVGWIVIIAFGTYALAGLVVIARMTIECAGGGCP